MKDPKPQSLALDVLNEKLYELKAKKAHMEILETTDHDGYLYPDHIKKRVSDNIKNISEAIKKLES